MIEIGDDECKPSDSPAFIGVSEDSIVAAGE